MRIEPPQIELDFLAPGDTKLGGGLSQVCSRGVFRKQSERIRVVIHRAFFA
jgi:hypothetical protein